MSDLSHSCPTCGGEGLEYPTPSFSESHPLPVPCPDCVEGYPKDRIERAALVVCVSDDHYDPTVEQPCFDHIEITLAAIRAFHTEGTEIDV